MSSTTRLASYNIRKCRGLDRRRRPGRILDILNDIGADIIALQEADRRLGARPAALPARMIEQETDFQAVPLARNHVSLGWHGNAVLVKKGIEARNFRHIHLPGFEPRGAVALDVGDLTVVAVHLGLRRRDRLTQLAHIRDEVGAARRTVILGDFNEWSPRRGMEPLEDHYAIHAPGRSFHAARPVAALDRFALGSDLELRDAGVIETKLSRIASDHLPVWADVSG
ncbi:MAG: endonuclease/exonuclease/phosphatase family protein [Rhodobacteraceae bacterium]|nr:endonuclease/exonuclease/phosphatase family protein [Paracoccaceae bacterium]